MAKPLDLAQRGHVVHGRRNIIHNGAFIVDQRGTSVTISNGTNKTVDRWRCSSASLDEATVEMQQSTTVPSGAGFGNSLQFYVTVEESAIAADEFLWVGHFIEGQNLQHLAHGTSSAKKITLSFWVRSHVAGDFGILFFKNNGISSRGYTTSYTVNAVGTWEYKTITIDGDTSGAILNDNSNQLGIYFALAAGSDAKGGGTADWSDYQADHFTISAQTNILSATGSWYITGVQLEVGDTATPFEHRSYGEELALCQRYYQLNSPGTGVSYTTTDLTVAFPAIVPFRTAPAASDMTIINGTNAAVDPGVSLRNITAVPSLPLAGDVNGVLANLTVATTTNGKTHSVFGGVIGIDVDL